MVQILTLKAASVLAAGDLVEFTATGEVTLASSGTTTFAGLVLVGGDAGDYVSVIASDYIVEMEASAAISPGAKVAVSGTNTVAAATAYDQVIGVALEAASAAGDKIKVLLK